MRIVELNRNRLRQILELTPLREMLREHVLERGADKEVLLLEAQLFALRRRIVRIQHAREILRFDLIGNCRRVVTGVERLDLERRDAATGPQSQMIHRRAAIAGNEHVVPDCPDILCVDPFVADATLLVTRRIAPTAEPYAIAHATVPTLPMVVHAEPRACDFALRAIFTD